MTPTTVQKRIRAIECARRTLEREEERHERRSHQLVQRLVEIQTQCSHPNLEEDRDAWSTSYRCPDCGAYWYEPLPADIRAAHIRARYEELQRKEDALRARQRGAKTKRAERSIGKRIEMVFHARHALSNACPHLHMKDEKGLYGPYRWCEDCRWSNGL